MGAHGGSDRPICQMGSSKCIADVILNALMEDGPTIVIGTNGKIADGKIDTVKRVLLKADRLSDTPEEVMHLASDRLADVKFAWVLSNNKPLAVFRKDADVFVKADVAIPDYLAW
jgi:hypothetical protein